MPLGNESGIDSDRVGADQPRFRYRTSSVSELYQKQFDLVQNSSVPVCSGPPENRLASVPDRFTGIRQSQPFGNTTARPRSPMDDSAAGFGLDIPFWSGFSYETYSVRNPISHRSQPVEVSQIMSGSNTVLQWVPLSSDKFDHSLLGTVTNGYCLTESLPTYMNGNGRDPSASTL